LGPLDFTQEYYTLRQKQILKQNPEFRPRFRQLYVTFKSENTLQNIFVSKDIWSLHIQEYAARILPVNTKSEIYKERSDYCYKFTGVPLNCNFYDLEPILKKLQARACVIEGYKQNGCTKAFIYTSPKCFDNNKFTSWNIFGAKIYCTVSSSNYSSCNACGNPTHPVEDCNKSTFSKRYNNYSFRSILIRRSNNLNNFNRERFSFRNNSTKNKMDTSDNDTSTPPTPSTKFHSVYKDALPIFFYNSPKVVTIKTTNDNNIDDDNFSTTSSKHNSPPNNVGKNKKSSSSNSKKSQKKNKVIRNNPTLNRNKIADLASATKSKDIKGKSPTSINNNESCDKEQYEQIIKQLKESNDSLVIHNKELTRKIDILEQAIIKQNTTNDLLISKIDSIKTDLSGAIDLKIMNYFSHTLEPKVKKIIANETHGRFHTPQPTAIVNNQQYSQFSVPTYNHPNTFPYFNPQNTTIQSEQFDTESVASHHTDVTEVPISEKGENYEEESPITDNEAQSSIFGGMSSLWNGRTRSTSNKPGRRY